MLYKLKGHTFVLPRIFSGEAKMNMNFHLFYKYAPYAFIGAAIMLCGSVTSPGASKPGSANADIKVLGTSNLHNWSMENKNVTCSVQFTYEAGRTIPSSLAVFTFSFPIHSLKSGKSSMDSTAYDAMKAKTKGNIVFVASSSTITPGANDRFTVKSNGSLTVAGVTKAVVLTAACKIMAYGSVICTGADSLFMTDYQVTPPTYLLETLRTGNALAIDFTMVVRK